MLAQPYKFPHLNTDLLYNIALNTSTETDHVTKHTCAFMFTTGQIVLHIIICANCVTHRHILPTVLFNSKYNINNTYWITHLIQWCAPIGYSTAKCTLILQNYSWCSHFSRLFIVNRCPCSGFLRTTNIYCRHINVKQICFLDILDENRIYRTFNNDIVGKFSNIVDFHPRQLIVEADQLS